MRRARGAVLRRGRRGVARCSRAARRAARQIVAAVRRDRPAAAARGPVPVVGRPPLPAPPFPEGFRYARKLVLPRYAAFAGAEHDVHAEVRVAWLAAKQCRASSCGEHIPKRFRRVVDYTGAVVSRWPRWSGSGPSSRRAGRRTFCPSSSTRATTRPHDGRRDGLRGVARFVNHSRAELRGRADAVDTPVPADARARAGEYREFQHSRSTTRAPRYGRGVAARRRYKHAGVVVARHVHEIFFCLRINGNARVRTQTAHGVDLPPALAARRRQGAASALPAAGAPCEASLMSSRRRSMLHTASKSRPAAVGAAMSSNVLAGTSTRGYQRRVGAFRSGPAVRRAKS